MKQASWALPFRLTFLFFKYFPNQGSTSFYLCILNNPPVTRIQRVGRGGDQKAAHLEWIEQTHG